ncbi:MAG: prepilin-type N-terminal cleavage/methylation domain-containing protein [Candidatus Magasanikbacteria bacterium]|nr:prepilin-type N-terminal cleavage/methylation domain-containing protein [Candidatus Magasanikbacteria bacterium]
MTKFGIIVDMKKKKFGNSGFTLIEITVAIAIFLIFAVGIYSTISMVFKIVYQSRMKILETALLSEQLEIAHNIPYDSVGIVNGIPAGVLLHNQTIVRNGASFTVITSVRNIDDPFDGILGGSPNDTAPADYKQVEISAICTNCTQQEPVILSTIVAPKNLEGASKNGALFIHVFDANGIAVPQANVHIVNTAANPDVILDDVTGNDGTLQIIDAPTGTLSYNITVSKNGFSSDYTVTSSVANPNPLKPPSNVVSQAITEISFSIDALSNLNISSLDPTCAALAGPSAVLNGEKVIGANPNVYKINQNFSLSSNNYSFNNIEWDTYHINLSGTTYDLAGTVPMLPIKLNPGATQNISLVLKPHTTNSLLVKVKDAGTGLPLSDATVHLYKTGFDDSLQTDLGYIRQTDWSGGSAQTNFIDETKYFVDSGTLDKTISPGDLKLKKSGSFYSVGGNLESSTFDLGSSVTLRNIIFEPISQPAQTGSSPILFQLAATNTPNATIWNYNGPDGNNNTYYSATSSVIFSGLAGNRYLRYKVFLSTADNLYTPQLSEVNITFSNNCVPPGQAFWNGLSSGTYTMDVSRTGYTTSNSTLTVGGNGEVEINLSAS